MSRWRLKNILAIEEQKISLFGISKFFLLCFESHLKKKVRLKSGESSAELSVQRYSFLGNRFYSL